MWLYSLAREATGMLLEELSVKIDDIHVPVNRRRTLKAKTVGELAESILENGLEKPIGVRRDGERFVLVTGLHRLEACKALGEENITAIIVGARHY